MTLNAWDRVLFATSYTVVLPTLRRTVRVLPERTVRRLRDRAERREAAATYMDETVRVGILRRMAVDRFDVRSDATSIHLHELRTRSGRGQ
jgi:hypothetical protein